MIKNNVMKEIDLVIKNIWKEDLSIDYDQNYRLKEDSMKNAFYFHLRTRLGNDFVPIG
ncbi:hypothetical protein [Gracilibacillus saliphilus]|uniref:hypothetical protein n=1 Tax=Gracilibacillus saliphilus TaxID=543890 RepID=UPI0013D63653|nr:hypothetical protein [Gracilibacillus saliphilus]